MKTISRVSGGLLGIALFFAILGAGAPGYTIPTSSGTVTNTGGSLTAKAIVLGAGASNVKVAPGISTDGASQLSLGVSGASVGAVVLNNASTGTITIQPTTGALGSTVISAPATSGTIITSGDSGTITNNMIATGTINLSNKVTGTLSYNLGGTGQSTYNAGDLVWAIGNNSLSRLSVGSTGQVLSVTSLNTLGWSNPVSFTTTSGNIFPFGGNTFYELTGTSTINLPSAIGNAGRMYWFLNSSLQTVTIASSGSSINGNSSANYLLTSQNSQAGFISDGNGWFSYGVSGEMISSKVASSSAVSVLSLTPASITSVTLSNGKWELIGNANFTLSSTLLNTAIGCGIGTNSIVLPSDGTECYGGWTSTSTTNFTFSICPHVIVTVTNGSTTYYLVQSANFTGTIHAYGSLVAKRLN